MKKQIFTIAFIMPALFAGSQEITTALLKNGAGGFKFVRTTAVENQAGDGLDTLEIYYHPERWQDSANIRAYLIAMVGASEQAQADLRQAVKREAAAADFYAAAYDSIFGRGSFLAMEKNRVLGELQGAWRLIEKDANTRPLEINETIAALPGKEGQIAITDGLAVGITGLYNFPLEFTKQRNGWIATRKTTTGERVFLLRR